MASLAEIRAKLSSMESKPGSNNKQCDNAIFPLWNIDEGTSATYLGSYQIVILTILSFGLNVK